MDFNDSLELLTQKGVEEFKKQVLNGYSSEQIRMPVGGDVLGLNHDLNKKLSILSNSFLKIIFNIQFRKPQISNFSSLSISRKPQFNYKDKTLNVRLNFDKIIIQSSDLDINSKYKIFRLTKKNTYNSDFKIILSNLNLDFLFNFNLGFNLRKCSISALGSQINFDNIKVKCKHNEFSFCLYPYIKRMLSKQLAKKISDLLTTNIHILYHLQKEFFDKIVDAYQIKIKEGGWGTDQIPRSLQGFDSIGQLPLPTLWELPAVDEINLKYKSLKTIMEKSQTGDLILFSGTLLSSQRIRRMTQSPFSHVVLVVKDADMADAKTLAWQATASSHRALLRDMESKPGLQLNFLDEVIDDYREEAPGAVVVYRKLIQNGRNVKVAEKYRKQLIDYIRMMDGKPYTDDMDKLYLMGLFEVKDPGRANYNCAGLVADSLMRLGVLDSIFMQHQYAPRDFSSFQINCPFVKNFSYEDDIIIKA